jgi:hypothetical protein
MAKLGQDGDRVQGGFDANDAVKGNLRRFALCAEFCFAGFMCSMTLPPEFGVISLKG